MEPPENDVGQELLDVSRGDPSRARMLRESLRRLAEHGEQPELREMARDVLAGRTTLRAAILAQAYRESLGEQVTKFLDWHRNLSPEELKRQEAAGREQLERFRATAEAAARGRSGAEPEVERPELGRTAAARGRRRSGARGRAAGTWWDSGRRGRSGAEPEVERPELGGTAAARGRSGAEPAIKRPVSGSPPAGGLD